MTTYIYEETKTLSNYKMTFIAAVKEELLFLSNEDINITFDKKRCTQIANNNQNQFLDLFYSKRTPKYLHMFRLYDFSNCLID